MQKTHTKASLKTNFRKIKEKPTLLYHPHNSLNTLISQSPIRALQVQEMKGFKESKTETSNS